jgi:hypothetical protein
MDLWETDDAEEVLGTCRAARAGVRAVLLPSGEAPDRADGCPPLQVPSRADLPYAPVSVDVGAGGFNGETTTDHIVELLGGRIIGIEPDPARCRSLEEKYKGRIEVVNGYYGKIGARTPFDLLVIGIGTQLIRDIFSKLLQFGIEGGLKVGGYVVPRVRL